MPLVNLLKWYTLLNGHILSQDFLILCRNWPKWDLKPWPEANGAHALTTEQYGQTKWCAQQSAGLSDHKVPKSWPGWFQWWSLNHIWCEPFIFPVLSLLLRGNFWLGPSL